MFLRDYPYYIDKEPSCQRPEGFAINGGKGWANVVFENHFINVMGEVAIAMGNYYFTSCADGSKTKVEYTFGYTKNSDGKEGAFEITSMFVGCVRGPWGCMGMLR